MNDQRLSARQHAFWEQEHQTPVVFPSVASERVTMGAVLLLEYLSERHKLGTLAGLEIGCGRGRNVLYMAEQGVLMRGMDFSRRALAEARQRAITRGIANIEWLEGDVTRQWPIQNSSVDFVFDSFLTTEIPGAENRVRIVREALRVLRPGGFHCVFTLSHEEEFHAEQIKTDPGPEPGSLFHSGGKFEKTFEQQELLNLHSCFSLIELRRLEKDTEIKSQNYSCRHWWALFQKKSDPVSVLAPAKKCP